MKANSRPSLRLCPVCGITMQASKSTDQLPHYDTFQCLTCDTTIVETSRPKPDRPTS